MRSDLAALTPEAIGALSNMGLVKRATREIEEGKGPRLEEDPDGTVRGFFEDGVVATLPPGKSLAQGSCTCGATTVCRHRVAVALAYPRGEAEAEEPWSPGAIGDQELERFLGKRLLEKARVLLARGYRAQVEGAAVRLPTCSVRFLVPRELAMARCDCADKGACEHLALAVWAARQGKQTVEFGATRARRHELSAVEALSERLLREGVVHAEGLEARFEKARRQLAAERMTWPLVLLDSLQEQLALYKASSGRYKVGEAAFALLSLRSRLAGVSELSATYVLGQDTAPETELDHLRLISLGARIQGDRVRLYLADPVGQVLVLERAYTGPGVTLAGDVRLRDLARGQLVSQGVRRHANRSLTLRREKSKHSVMPLGRAWESLPESLQSLEFPPRPPRLLRPLVLAEDFVVLGVAELEVAFAPGEQEIVASAVLPDGQEVRIARAYEGAVPGALDALAHGLPSAVQVSGFLRHEGGELLLEPVAFRTPERVVVPDLEDPAPDWDLPLVALDPPANPLAGLVRKAWGLCEESVHFGTEQLSGGFSERRAELAGELREHGLQSLAARLEGEWDWYPAALRAWLAGELLSG